MAEFIKIARFDDLPERRGKFIRVEDEELALFKIDGKVYIIGNVCPHQHISALHQGELNGLTITCPMHGWTYSLESGLAIGGSGRVRVYRAKVVGENVLVEIGNE